MPRRGACGLVMLGGLLLVGTACGRGTNDGAGETVDRAAFEARLIEREQITDEQARCVSDYAYAGYEPEAIRVIYDEGFTSLPSGLWGEYAHAMVACVFEDELGPASPSGTAPGSTSGSTAGSTPGSTTGSTPVTTVTAAPS